MGLGLVLLAAIFGGRAYWKRNEKTWLPTARGLPANESNESNESSSPEEQQQQQQGGAPSGPTPGGSTPGRSTQSGPTSSTTPSGGGGGGSASSTSAPAEAPLKVKDTQRLDAAATIAQALVKELRAKGKNYSRVLMTKFQRTAGIGADGKYGPESAGALRWYTMTVSEPKGIEIPPIIGSGFKTYMPKF